MLNTVELNIAEERSWTFGSPLPDAMYGLRGVTVLSQFYVTGETLYSDTMIRLVKICRIEIPPANQAKW